MLRSLLLVSLVACAAEPVDSGGPRNPMDPRDPKDPPGGPVDPCAAAGDPYAAATLEAGVTYLADDARGGRKSGTPGDMETRAYIEAAFTCAGLVPGGTDGFQQAFVAPDGTHASNVVGYVMGSDPTAGVVIVGAHHDHLGTMGGQIYNGANDNASGAIALIAQARAIAAAHPRLTVGFVAFGYEEHDGNCEGSEYFAAHVPAELANVKYMVDMDMVGTYPLTNELTVYGASAGSRGRAILDERAPSYAELHVVHAGNAETDDSDFQAFADRAVPYVYFETWDEACYHMPCDDADRIDYASMSRVAQLGGELIAALAK